jgi:hypothetical protein
MNYVERFVIDEGHTAQRMAEDYGYDFILVTYDREGYAEPGLVYLQLKGASRLQLVGEAYVFDVEVRDYNLWNYELLLVILVLFDASRRRAYWVHVQDYFAQNAARRPAKGAKRVRVRVPASQAVNRRAVQKWCALKRAIQFRLGGALDNA